MPSALQLVILKGFCHEIKVIELFLKNKWRNKHTWVKFFKKLNFRRSHLLLRWEFCKNSSWIEEFFSTVIWHQMKFREHCLRKKWKKKHNWVKFFKQLNFSCSHLLLQLEFCKNSSGIEEFFSTVIRHQMKFREQCPRKEWKKKHNWVKLFKKLYFNCSHMLLQLEFFKNSFTLKKVMHKWRTLKMKFREHCLINKWRNKRVKFLRKLYFRRVKCKLRKYLIPLANRKKPTYNCALLEIARLMICFCKIYACCKCCYTFTFLLKIIKKVRVNTIINCQK